ncbi:MAG: hypothetical protein C0505_13105 [Leptothrix sp. (in: Bacteria)]|nr:hypothetical protein [Leptothrix sp. (in: b-proteobacteria)]
MARPVHRGGHARHAAGGAAAGRRRRRALPGGGAPHLHAATAHHHRPPRAPRGAVQPAGGVPAVNGDTDAGPGGLHLVSLVERPAVPWKNGGGLTHELLCWPTPEAWQLRISVAAVARSGPFSAWAGVARHFAVLQGAGVVLQMAPGDEGLTLTPDSPPLAFDGSLAPGCTLIDGPTLDLNLMARGGRAELARARPGVLWPCGMPLRAVFTLHGATLHGAASSPQRLPAGTLAWVVGAPCGAWQLTDAAPHGADWWLSFNPHAL